MVWIIILSVLVFLHCRIAGVIPLVLSIIGYRNYNKSTEEGMMRSQVIMKWAFITLIVSAVITVSLLIYLIHTVS